MAKHEAVELDQYSDDSQLRIKLKNSPDAAPQRRALATLSACVDDVTRWFIWNRVKVNIPKTTF